MSKSLFILFVVLFPVVTHCQQPATGMPPFGSFQTSSFDTVNRYNMNVNFAIPIVSSGGRGQPLNFAIVYDSSVWTRAGVTAWTANNGGGWKTNIPQGKLFYLTLSHVCDTVPPTHYTKYYSFTFTDSAGTPHPFGLSFYQTNSCDLNPQTPIGAFASDSSGYHLQANAPNSLVIATKGGAVVGAPSLIDSNGNVVSSTVVGSETDWTDSAGHLALKIVTVSSTETDYKYPDTTGTYQTAKLLFTSTQVKTNFGCSGVTEYTGTQYLPTELDLANGQKYTFTYEGTPGHSGYYTGRVQRVTLPTGGYYEYDYGATNDGVYCTDGSTNSMNRVENDGTSSNTWQYSRTPSGSNEVTTVTDPATNASAYTFNSIAQETIEKHYQGSTAGTLLRTINLTWASNSTPTSSITILEDNSTQNEAETSFDNYGNLLTLKEHDWGTGTPGPPLRTTTNEYLSTTPYVAANILNRVTLTTIADSTGTIHSRTATTYDDSAYTNTPCISGAAQHDDSAHGCTYTVRGNPTTITTYTDAQTPAGGVTKVFTYDSLGNLVGADMDCCQHKQWNYSVSTNYAYPDSVVSGPTGTQVTTNYTYNAYTGFMATSTDENSRTTTYAYSDPGHLNRLTNIRRPDGNSIAYSYDDTPLAGASTVTMPVQSANAVKQKTGYDGLGRSVTITTQDASNNSYSIVQTQYDSLGRPYKVSMPYVGSPAYYKTTAFDAIGRVTNVVTPDGTTPGTTTYSYGTSAGKVAVTSTSPSGKQKQSLFDGVGRLALVNEPDVTNSNQLTVQTGYTHTVTNALSTVTQGSQSRTYTYDDMGRVTSVKTPESNQVATTYLYNNYDLVTQRTDARGVITTYGYDPLNRLHTIAYNVGSTGVPATPGVVLNYGTTPSSNNVNRLISMTDGVGSEAYTYDSNLPLLTQVQKIMNSTTYTTSYGYNLVGELSSITYPSGRVITQTFDAIGRLSTIASGATNYATGFTYNTASQVTGFTYGNGVTATFGYSADRAQLTSINYANSSGAIYGVNYWYKQDATHCPSAPLGNDGSIQCITDSVQPGRSMTYAYDALSRVSTAGTSGSSGYPQWGLSWTYDRYGNRTAQTVTVGSAPANCLTISSTTNRVTDICSGGSGISYDANGNMTNDAQNNLTYDGENRVTGSSGPSGTGTYTYDGNSLRVTKVSGSTTTVYIFSGLRVIAEYVNGASPSSPTREYINWGGNVLAKIEAGVTQYYHEDHLSVRAMTDSSGNKIGEQGHLPYGESWYQTNTTTKWLFTSYERDGESSNDYALARYEVNRLGRFASPDAVAGSTRMPQSLNRYAYSLNDPINNSDRSGLSSDPLPITDLSSPTDCVPLMFIDIERTVYDASDPGMTEDLGLWAMCPKGIQPPRHRSDGDKKKIENARRLVNEILTGDNDCANFFNSSRLLKPGENAAGVFGTDTVDTYDGESEIKIEGNRRIEPTGATTDQGTGAGSTIKINLNGPFFQDSAPVAGQGPESREPLTVGGKGTYGGDGPGAQVTILLHELAHNLDLIPSDGNKPEQSKTNTKTILDNCQEAIDKVK